MDSSTGAAAFALNFSDWLVFFLVIFVTLAAVFAGHWYKKRKQQNEFIEYMLMGRQLTLPMFIATMVATWYGGILGVTEISFEYGIYNFVTQGVFWYIAYIIFAFYFIPKLNTGNSLSLADQVRNQHGSTAGKIAAVFNALNLVPVVYCISLGIVIQSTFGLAFETSMILGVCLVAGYSIFGGFRAVVTSDIVQFFVMCFSVLMVAVLSVYTFGGASFLSENLPASHFTITGGNSVSSLFVWGLIAISTWVDPNFYQRCFAAESPKIAKKGLLISTLVWLVFDICTTLGGLYARAVIPEADPKLAYLSYSLNLLPHGLKGLFLAGVVATILSTLDSYLFLGGQSISFDFFGKTSKKARAIGIGCVALLSVTLAMSFEGNIRLVWKTLGSYSAGCLLFPMCLSLFYPQKITSKQFIGMTLFGAFTVSYWRLGYLPESLAQIDDLYAGIATTFIAWFVLNRKKMAP